MVMVAPSVVYLGEFCAEHCVCLDELYKYERWIFKRKMFGARFTTFVTFAGSNFFK